MNWQKQLKTAISDPAHLLEILQIDMAPWQAGFAARKLFPLRVPLAFINRMEKGNIHDPLLKQVLPVEQELDILPGFTKDPLHEQQTSTPGMLHKYHNRVLMITKGGCAINCRYCFRRHFPYQDHPGSKAKWQQNLDYIQLHPEIDEVILSGGDPLMAKDEELSWLLDNIAAIDHIKRVRIHTRLAVVIPDRITDSLCQLLAATRLQVVLVTHINHANEIDQAVAVAMRKLQAASVRLLNQSVLLKGVNDQVAILVQLNEALFDQGIQPYYLHLLDPVEGAGHFCVSDRQARQLMRGVMALQSGYLIPKLMRETAGEASKTLINIYEAE